MEILAITALREARLVNLIPIAFLMTIDVGKERWDVARICRATTEPYRNSGKQRKSANEMEMENCFGFEFHDFQFCCCFLMLLQRFHVVEVNSYHRIRIRNSIT